MLGAAIFLTPDEVEQAREGGQVTITTETEASSSEPGT